MGASRIANVTAAIARRPIAHAAAGACSDGGDAAGSEASAPAASDAERLAQLCRALFDDVLWIEGEGEPPAGCRGVNPGCEPDDVLAALCAAAAVARGERLLWLEPDRAPGATFRADAMLALVAWPEQAAVELVDAAGRALPLAIYRRDALLAQRCGPEAQRGQARASQRRTPGLEPERVTLAALGLEGELPASFVWHGGME